MMEQQIKLAAKLYRYRDTMKRLFGDQYPDKIKTYTDILSKYSAKRNLDTLKAVLEICDDPEISQNEMAVVLFMTAAVEIIEPSIPSPKPAQ